MTDFLEQETKKREVRLVDTFESKEMWECTSCNELFADLIIGPVQNVRECEYCGNKEFKITKMIRPIRKIIWQN